MIALLTASDLRNTLCGRLKLQKNPKNENYIVTDTIWPIIGILQNIKFLLRKRYNKPTVTIIWLFFSESSIKTFATLYFKLSP